MSRLMPSLLCLALAACSSSEGDSAGSTGEAATSLSGSSSSASSETGSSGTDSESSSGSDASSSGTTSGTGSGGTDTTDASTSASGDGDGDGDGDAPPRVETMQVYLADALERATDIDAGATLVQVNGFGLRGDGSIDLEGNTGFVRRWSFGFTSPSGDISVIYMSEDWVGDYPQIEYPAGNVTATEAIISPASLPDSDLVASTFQAESGCGSLDGNDGISLLYRHQADLGGNLVQITANGVTWGAVVPGFSVWDSCL